MNVYLLSRERRPETVWRFANQYVDVAAGFDRGDAELMVLPILHDDNPGSNHPEESDASLGIDDYDWIPSRTLADAINLGVSRPWRTFVIPSLPPRWPGVQSASVGFTADGAVVFGLQVEGVGAAKELLEQLLADFSWSIALMSELRSPSSEADALAMAKNEKTFLYRLHDVEGPA